MNAPDLAPICNCDRLIRFKIDDSTIRTHLTFAIKHVLKSSLVIIMQKLPYNYNRLKKIQTLMIRDIVVPENYSDIPLATLSV